MHRYVIKRILLLIPVIIGVSFMIYFIMDLAPGDIITQLVGEDASEEQIMAILKEVVTATNEKLESYKKIKNTVLRMTEFEKNTSKKIKRY